MNNLELIHHWSLVSLTIISVLTLILVILDVWVDNKSKWWQWNSDKIIITGFILFMANIGVSIVSQLLQKIH